jgi:hypothetical protein
MRADPACVDPIIGPCPKTISKSDISPRALRQSPEDAMAGDGRWTWDRLKALALSLDLPEFTEATSWGNPCLKAHGKLWAWWSPHEDAPVFKVAKDLREIMVEAEPEVFFYTDHYRAWGLVLMRPEQFDEPWARQNLMATWRAQAPKRWLKDWDAAQAAGAAQG